VERTLVEEEQDRHDRPHSTHGCRAGCGGPARFFRSQHAIDQEISAFADSIGLEDGDIADDSIPYSSTAALFVAAGGNLAEIERVKRLEAIEALKWIMLKQKQHQLMEQAIEDAKAE
jgi:hypothetical protein